MARSWTLESAPHLLGMQDDLLAELFSYASVPELYMLLMVSKSCCKHVEAASERRAQHHHRRPLPAPLRFGLGTDSALHRLHFLDTLLAQVNTISASDAHTVCMRPADGKAFSCGSGPEVDEHEHEELHAAVVAANQDAANQEHGDELVCLAQLGQGVMIGPNAFEARPMLGLDSVVVREVAASNKHTLILGMCGGVWSCGIRFLHADYDSSPGYVVESHRCAFGQATPTEVTVPRRIEAYNSWDADQEIVRRAHHQVRICRIAAAETHSLLLCDDGNLYSCGEGCRGQLGHGDFAHRCVPTAVQRRFFSTCTILGIGPLTMHKVCDRPCQMSAYNGFSLAVTHYGSLCSWGLGSAALGLGPTHGADLANLNSVCVPRRVSFPDGVRIKQAVAANNRTLAVTREGSLYTCGSHYDRLGHDLAPGGLSGPAFLPRLVSALAGKRVRAVAAGYGHNVVLTDEGEVFTFGDGGHLQLGHATEDGLGDDVHAPTVVKALEGLGVVEVAAGGAHTIVRLASGELRTFGSNGYGQLGQPELELLHSATPGELWLPPATPGALLHPDSIPPFPPGF